MNLLNRTRVLNTLRKHETLTLDDVSKEENLGMVPNKEHLDFMLGELTDSGFLQILDGANPITYTITEKGIEEYNRLNEDGNSTDGTLTSQG